MEYMGDAHWWNNRFSSRSSQLMQHDSMLEKDKNIFPATGRVLDVACGDGRNAIYLSKNGYSVDAIDFSEIALDRLKSFAEKDEQQIRTMLIDLTKESSFDLLNEYDLIIVNHYRLGKTLYSVLEKHLKSEGVLWVNGFRKAPDSNPNITENDLLVDDDFKNLTECTLENKKMYDNGEHKLVRYLFRKQ